MENLKEIIEKYDTLNEDDKKILLNTIDHIVRRNNRYDFEEEQKIIPIKTGENTMIEIFITDEDKAFSYFMKALNNRIDISENGFTVENLSFSKDRYKNLLKSELVNDIINTTNNTMDKFRKEIYDMMNEDI